MGLRGISAWTGEEFRIVESQQAIDNQRVSMDAGSYAQTLKMVGQTTHRSFLIVARGNYLIDGTGEIRVSRDELRVECDEVRGRTSFLDTCSADGIA